MIVIPPILFPPHPPVRQFIPISLDGIGIFDKQWASADNSRTTNLVVGVLWLLRMQLRRHKRSSSTLYRVFKEQMEPTSISLAIL